MNAQKITKELLARGYIHPRRHQIEVTRRYQAHRNGRVCIEGREVYDWQNGIYHKPGMLRLVRALKGVGRPVCSVVRWKRGSNPQ